ncbi:uncharacterized protein [Hoplias malabaricus]|uniref:uncharacterized protein n=1 Tax=Hoplias malabaricus TaxID=27720 RepID=UPI00346313D5
MPVEQVFKLFIGVLRKNVALALILTGLIFSEKFAENDFVCPCEKDWTEVLFCIYLVLPAFIAFTVTFYIACGVKSSASDGTRRDGAQSSDGCDQIVNILIKTAYSFIPVFFWVLLFLCDGRYVACIRTKLNTEYTDSNNNPPWEWCSINRTLTKDQLDAQLSFYISKLAGFGLLLVISLFALIYKCSVEYSKACCKAYCKKNCCQCCKQCCEEKEDPSFTRDVVVENLNFQMKQARIHDQDSSQLGQTLLNTKQLTFKLKLKESAQPNLPEEQELEETTRLTQQQDEGPTPWGKVCLTRGFGSFL